MGLRSATDKHLRHHAQALQALPSGLALESSFIEGFKP
jgi:hypothetical protein